MEAMRVLIVLWALVAMIALLMFGHARAKATRFERELFDEKCQSSRLYKYIVLLLEAERLHEFTFRQEDVDQVDLERMSVTIKLRPKAVRIALTSKG